MYKYREINNRLYIRFRYKNLWIELESDFPIVYSYDTKIGFIDWQNHIFKTWGYRRYSSTTSKQITALCNYYKLQRIDIKEEN